MNLFRCFVIVGIVLVLIGSPVLGEDSKAELIEDFSGGDVGWRQYLDQKAEWVVDDGVLRAVKGRDSARLVGLEAVSDVIVETEVRVLASSNRKCFGVVLGAKEDNSCVVLRYYDSTDSLELLRYKGGRIDRGPFGPKGIGFVPDRWYRMKAAVVGGEIFGKIWPSGGEEPEWQLQTKIDNVGAGDVGVVAQDSVGVEFNEVRVWTGGDLIERLRKKAAAEKAAREKVLRESLKIKVVVSPVAQQDEKAGVRRVDVVSLANGERYPVGGSLSVSFGGTEREFVLAESDVVYGVYSFTVPEPRRATRLKVTFDTAVGKRLEASAVIRTGGEWSWGKYVSTCLDTLIEHGTDRYGSVHTPMLMSILDVYTLDSPQEPELLDAKIRTEGRPTHGRLSPGGTNLWLDQPVLKAMYECSKRTGDSKYSKAADAYFDYAMKNCRKSNGMFVWGSHSYWHGYSEKGSGDGLHEILIKHADWASMYRLNPDAVREEIEGIWKWHVVDKKTGLHNRHDDGNVGCDFAFSGGSFAIAFSFMYNVTGDESYLDKARTVADWHWNHRDAKTGLVPDAPRLTSRYDGKHCMTSTIGPHVSQMLKCFELTGDGHFRDVAIGYIKAYEKYGWDEKARTYYGMLELDGTPVPDKGKGSGYDAWAPYGHIDVWRASMYSYEMPLIAAQAAVYAYELSGADAGSRDKELLVTARHWAEVIEKNLPVSVGRRWGKDIEAAMPEILKTGGTYAENYGRTISFFVHLYRATGEERYLKLAEGLGRETVETMYVNGLFKGHAAKPYYQTNDGVGFLLYALLELDGPGVAMAGAF